MIRIDLRELPQTDDSLEWLETDGSGGYASSTLVDRHTRRYHGLFVANLRKPEGRHVLLSKLEDSLLSGGEEHFFSSHRYPGLLFPPGRPLIREFRLDLCPSFVSLVGRISVKRAILMPHQKELLLIRYDLERCPPGTTLRLKPFLAYRGYHKLSCENGFLHGRPEAIENGFRIEPYAGMPPLVVRTSRASRFTPAPHWYNRFQYSEEQQRGFDWEEDLFLPGIIDIPVERKCTVILSVHCDRGGARPSPPRDPAAIWKTELIRRGRERTAGLKEIGRFTGEDRELVVALQQAARSFLITTPSGRPAVIAGYPWFGSWSRDTLISLPGLCFATGRIADGIQILTEIGRHERAGLLPNFFSADGEPDAYNTVDSSLWYFWAVQELLRAGGDQALVRDHFWPVMERIVRSFSDGTHFGIGVNENGLLHAGDERTALTWMDATVAGIPVTPRHGYPVEINALWYNALRFTADLAAEFSVPPLFSSESLSRLRRSFRDTFWNPEQRCLGDFFRNGVLDRAVRPNQLFAVSLPFSPLDPADQAAVVDAVRRQLLVPCGLRTLSPSDPAYRGRYRGNPAERDSAYHQGTVWPWLLGPFGTAALRVAADPERERETLRDHLRSFLRQHLSEAGIGSVSEVFDGDAPHRPGGCIAQAWSVAELLRLYTLLA